MTKVLVLYYSSFGHIEQMAHALAEGARAAGATADVKRVPENVPEEIAKAFHFKLDQSAPIAKVEELANYDAIVVGAPTRFGRMPSAMGSFWEQAGALWMSGALLGKVGGAFTSSATQHGGNETTLFSIIANLMHFGFVIVGLPYSHAGQMTLDEIVGGAPYGATTIAGAQGQRHPTNSNSTAPGIKGSLSPRSPPSFPVEARNALRKVGARSILSPKGERMSDVVSRPALPIVGSILRAPEMLSVLRILTGLLFLEHGTGKLLGFPAGLPFIDQMPASLLYVTGTLELIGGLLITIGLFTRPVAFILSGFMGSPIFWCTFHRASSRPRTMGSRRCCSASYFSTLPPSAPGHGRFGEIELVLSAAGRPHGAQTAHGGAPCRTGFMNC